MRSATLAAAFTAGLALAPAAFGQEVREVWRVTGFERPESVAYEPGSKLLYVSNIGGDPSAHDGNGFLSRITLDGKLETMRWLEGLDAPKGIAIAGNTLYVADIDRLVEVDIAAGQIADAYPAPGGKFLNDVAIGPDGQVFVSDSAGNAIYVLQEGVLSLWLADAGLNGPNGLYVDTEAGRLLVAELGVGGSAPGRVRTVDLATKAVGDYGGSEPVGVLDGIAAVPRGDAVVVTDNPAGRLIGVEADGGRLDLGAPGAGAADFAIVTEAEIIAVPVMSAGAVVGMH
jgi:DNA-binding beta-propeller fold protein YncE